VLFSAIDLQFIEFPSDTNDCTFINCDVLDNTPKLSGNKYRNLQERYQSSYAGSFARRARDMDGPNESSLLKEIYRSDPEKVIRIFESQPSLHSSPSALSEYVKALVKVDRLDESSLLRTLQRGTIVL
jgi:ATP-dependent metalloprotease